MATADQPDDTTLLPGPDPVLQDLYGITDAIDTKYRAQEQVAADEFTTGDAHRYLRQQYEDDTLSPEAADIVEEDTMAADRRLRDVLRDGVAAGELDSRWVTISYNTEHEARPMLYRFVD